MQKKGSTYSDIHTFANAVAKMEKFLKREISRKKRYYEPTRLLYIKLAQKLEECVKIAYRLAGKKVTLKITVEELKEEPAPHVDIISEPVFDLAMSSMQNSSTSQLPVKVDKHAAKKIVATYLIAGKKLASGQGFGNYRQVLKCASLMSQWLQLRFGRKSDMFHYNPENIKIWIDKFIYAYGYHWHYQLSDKFEIDLNDWFDSMRKVDCKYPLPSFIFGFGTESDDDPDIYCAEVLLLERLLKIVIYSDAFYPEQMHNIEPKILSIHPEYAELKPVELYEKCTET